MVHTKAINKGIKLPTMIKPTKQAIQVYHQRNPNHITKLNKIYL